MLTDGSIAAIYIVNNLLPRKARKFSAWRPSFLTTCPMPDSFGMNYRYVALDRADRYKFDVNALLAQITDDLAAVYLDNPNNPTGQMITAGRLKWCCAERKQRVSVSFWTRPMGILYQRGVRYAADGRVRKTSSYCEPCQSWFLAWLAFVQAISPHQRS